MKYLLLALFIPTLVYGEIYKCENNTGGISYSDDPCQNEDNITVIENSDLISLNVLTPFEEKKQEEKKTCKLDYNSKNEINRRYDNLEKEVIDSNITKKAKDIVLSEIKFNRSKALSANYSFTKGFWSVKIQHDNLLKEAKQNSNGKITYDNAINVIEIERSRDSFLYFFDKDCQSESDILTGDSYNNRLYVEENYKNQVHQVETTPNNNNIGVIDVNSGILMPSVAGGIIDPRNGTFHTDVGGGYINTQTGQFSPKF